ncbi:unnamed protein product [Strongylus vulgaris]|uniref:Uncharacterized protein n=1 Tax=Strongylus vulgaris TaxID=40348 RepID=A0A3P7LU74_STRVU|nr:unnamed protein product [Strongylus vulgaris]
MLVRWANSSICDVHYPDKTKTQGPMFFYECNGTSWNVQSYPIDSIICAAKI